MSDDLRAGERAYHEIKRAILTGEFRLRQRLDIEHLAERFRVSATPVRQALAILTAERLVSTGALRGYRVVFWSERELSELYQWRGQLARLAAETYAPRPLTDAVWRKGSYEEGFAALMDVLDSRANLEVRQAGRAANERLSAALRAEPHVFASAQADLDALAAALGLSSTGRIQQRLKRHFQKRIDQAGAIRAAAHARAIPANGD